LKLQIFINIIFSRRADSGGCGGCRFYNNAHPRHWRHRPGHEAREQAVGGARMHIQHESFS